MSLRKAFWVTVAAGLLLSGGAGAESFVVNTTAGEGDGSCEAVPGGCSLWDAIEATNARPGRDRVRFDAELFAPGQAVPIVVTAVLPAFEDPSGVAVDGRGVEVVIDGSELSFGAGLRFHSPPGSKLWRVSVRDLVLQNFPSTGLIVCGGGGSCEGGVFGLRVEGVAARDNGNQGIAVAGGELRGLVLRDVEASGSLAAGIGLWANAEAHAIRIVGAMASGNGTHGITVESLGGLRGVQIRDVSTHGNVANGIRIHSFEDVVAPRVQQIEAMDNGISGLFISGKNVIEARIRDVVAEGNDGGVSVNAVEENRGTRLSAVRARNNVYTGVGVLSSGEGLQSRARVRNLESSGNQQGIFLSGSDNQIRDVVASGNETWGLALGWDAEDYTGGGNRISGVHADDNELAGLHVAEGSTGNRIQRVEAFGNGDFDLEDENPDCADNRWRHNLFGTANQACIE